MDRVEMATFRGGALDRNEDKPSSFSSSSKNPFRTRLFVFRLSIDRVLNDGRVRR